MRVSFIGAGKVGAAIGKYLQATNEVIYYYSKTRASADEVSRYVGCDFTEDMTTLIEASEVIFITTPDNNIQSVVEEIANLSVDMHDKYLVHMSGAMTSDVFKSLSGKVKGIASIHPLQTFSDRDKAVADLSKAYFAYEGDNGVLLEWLKTFTERYFVLKKEQKIQYHLSACVFSNYLVTLMDYGNRLLEEIGIEMGLQAMEPLIRATLENVLERGPKAALTGPIQRGDTKTLEKHMSILQGDDLRSYQMLGQMTTNNLIEHSEQKDTLNALWRHYDKEIHS